MMTNKKGRWVLVRSIGGDVKELSSGTSTEACEEAAKRESDKHGLLIMMRPAKKDKQHE